MRRLKLAVVSFCLMFALTASLTSLAVAADQKMSPEELVAKHLASIGTPEARAVVKGRTVAGPTRMSVHTPDNKDSAIGGAVQLNSDDRKMSFVIKLPDANYPGEKFIFDGAQTGIAPVKLNNRSSLGTFMVAHDIILKENLLGGTLTTGWPLQDLVGRKAKLSYDGIKKVNGVDLHQLTYKPKKNDDALTIRIYLEPETYRHVLTTYDVFLGSTRYKLQEKFSDFKPLNGLTLPSKWILSYTMDRDQNVTEMKWDTDLNQMVNN